jgi:hypothetical protein
MKMTSLCSKKKKTSSLAQSKASRDAYFLYIFGFVVGKKIEMKKRMRKKRRREEERCGRRNN